MKTNKLLFFAFVIGTLHSNAQLSLTKAANEPVAGDIQMSQGCDSVMALPKNTGLNQTWDFSNVVPDPLATESQSFVAIASAPASASLFPGATLAIKHATNYFDYCKSSATQFEYIGYNDVNAVMNYTNTQIAFIWPMAYGYNQTDTYGGQGTGTSTDTRTGSFTVTASGAGTLKLPGGQVFTNVLQVKTMLKDAQTDNTTSPPSGLTITATSYDYYHSSQKFPLLTVSYANLSDGSSTDADFGGVSMNQLVVVGLEKLSKESLFSVFPNPAKDFITVSLTNSDNKKVSVSISNTLGEVVKARELANSSFINEQINVSDLRTGIYFVKTEVGSNSEIKKIVIR